jgi:exodeoxyribonuclease-3
MSLGLITLNVGAPSLDRARRQLGWLAKRPEDVLVLTETKATPGSQFLADTFTAAGYSVTFPHHDHGDLGIMIISKVATIPDPITLDYLPARATGVVIDTSTGPVRVLGAYVPSRDATLDKTERKRRWIGAFRTALQATKTTAPAILVGDLNVLEPGHQPEHRQQFAAFEYDFYRALTDRHGLVDAFRYLHPDRVEHSWARRPELGYRYDHAHASLALIPHLTGCDYVHQTRETCPNGARLSDHSGLAVRLALSATAPLLTSDPIAASEPREPEHEPTLF